MDRLTAELERRAEPEIGRERTRQLFDRLPFALLSNLGIAGSLAGLLWFHGAARPQLALWLAGIGALMLLRGLLWRRFTRVRAGAFDPAVWTRRYTALMAPSGLLLGAAGVLFFQRDLLTLFALAVVLGLMALGSVMMHAAYRPAHQLYVLPLLLPFSLRCLLETDLPHVALGAGFLLLLPLTLLLGNRLQRNLLEAVRLRFHNEELIAELTRQTQLAQAAQQHAEQASTARTRFFAAASHDLRQPVQALELFSAALEHELREHPARALAGNIRAVGREFGELLHALLDYARIDAAAVQPSVRDFPLAELLERMDNEFRPQARARGLRLRVARSAAWVRSDPVLLERIVRNFLSNAIKYTQRGGILLGCRTGDASLRIEVHDTGIGIAAHQQQEVFNEFFQVDNPERDRRKGLGLGLAIVHGLARLLGHSLSLRSQPGRGSVFAVTLARGQVDPPPAAPAAVASATPAAWILLLENDPLIRLAAAGLLQAWGYRVTAAAALDEALALLPDNGPGPDALLADYRLDGTYNGIDAVRALRRRCARAVPAAILSGDTDPASAEAVRQAGLPLLHKPLAAAKLRALLANLLRAPAAAQPSETGA